ncbi:MULTISPECIES: YcgJ family protein [Cupriavidus]
MIRCFVRFVRFVRFLPLLLAAVLAAPAWAAKPGKVFSPGAGVLCDRYVCAGAGGISYALTEKYLGRKALERLRSQGEFDLTAFTFESGLFCDANQRVCRFGRYFDKNGVRDGVVSPKYTRLLFGQ